ncbi:hypothetical protein E2I00_011891 [Balaenoptera physalus]|uniref:Annexin A2 n=1 Tax=Balaenoptera physalus TaxID=9770 RepID=A0A643BNF1_BALPH|nr:hypothetical protein E2I00_011891 [Balaenoptera physalus]
MPGEMSGGPTRSYRKLTVYKEVYKTDLEKDIVSDISGDFCKRTVAPVKGRRGEDGYIIDFVLIDQDALDLYCTKEKRRGTEVLKWISIMIKWSVCHLQKVFERYKNYGHYNMLKSIKKEVKGDHENAFLNLAQCIHNKPLCFAVYDSMKGKGTHYKVLIRIMVSKLLYYYIQQDTKSDYQKVLCTCVVGMTEA